MPIRLNLLLFFFSTLWVLQSCGEKEDPIPVIEPLKYVTQERSGYSITLRESEQGHPDMTTALDRLAADLEEINTLVPSHLLEVMQFRAVWIKLSLQPNGAAWYHPNPDWLSANGHNPAKAFSIEISNARNYVAWRGMNQPYMVLHEMAHLVHHQYFKHDHHAIESAFGLARQSGRYESVPYFNGQNTSDQRAYALNNSQEYFSELTEAFFGKNDYYPFDYDDLKTFDPEGFALMESAWGAPPGKTHTRGITPPPAEPALDPFYMKHLDAGGLPVVASWIVYDEALARARDIVAHMISSLPPEAVEEMQRTKIRIGVIGANQRTTEMPEYRDLYEAFPGTDWDNRARGLGPTIARPLASAGEENLLGLPGDPYQGENILVHEFAHAIHQMGLQRAVPGFEEELLNTYHEAMAEGLWQNTYAAVNHAEYWAEGVQSWYDANAFADPPNGVHNQVNTREKLREYDPRLHALIAKYLPGDSVRF